MIDGSIAGKLGTVSDFGSKLDSTADLVFVAAAFWKLFPSVQMPLCLWGWIGSIVVVRVNMVLICFNRQRSFFFPHTVLNKVTGFLLFLLPLTISFMDLTHSAPPVCILASVAVMEEVCFMRGKQEIHK